MSFGAFSTKCVYDLLILCVYLRTDNVLDFDLNGSGNFIGLYTQYKDFH